MQDLKQVLLASTWDSVLESRSRVPVRLSGLQDRDDHGLSACAANTPTVGPLAAVWRRASYTGTQASWSGNKDLDPSAPEPRLDVRPLTDPFAPVISLSAFCRGFAQTAPLACSTRGAGRAIGAHIAGVVKGERSAALCSVGRPPAHAAYIGWTDGAWRLYAPQTLRRHKRHARIRRARRVRRGSDAARSRCWRGRDSRSRPCSVLQTGPPRFSGGSIENCATYPGTSRRVLL